MTEELNIQEHLSQALNFLDSLIGKYWKELDFEVIPEKSMIKLHARCKLCMEKTEIRLWLGDPNWPQDLVDTFLKKTAEHSRAHVKGFKTINPFPYGRGS